MLKTKQLGIFLIATMLLPFLLGCTDVAMSGAQAIYNHHSIQKNLSDQYITLQAYKKLDKVGPLFKNTNVSISTFNGEMLLAGQVPENWQRNKVELLVKEIPDVEGIHNLITISSPSSTLTRVSDAWITTKVKSKMIASDDLDATKIKVVTENGTVFLMGTIMPSEAQAAVDLASNTDGVNRVVKIFKYIRICKK